MPKRLICCVSLPPATRLCVPIYDFAVANEELAAEDMETYYACCGKEICKGCIYSFCKSGNDDKCPFCNSDRASTPHEEQVNDIRKRVAANDPTSICMLAGFHQDGRASLQQDQAKAIELFIKSAELGYSEAHCSLGSIYHEGGYIKKAAAMAGSEAARCNLGVMEANSGNMEHAVKHWNIAASAGSYRAMYHLISCFKKGAVSRESIDSTLAAYNSSCAEMRSKDRDAIIRYVAEAD